MKHVKLFEDFKARDELRKFIENFTKKSGYALYNTSEEMPESLYLLMLDGEEVDKKRIGKLLSKVEFLKYVAVAAPDEDTKYGNNIFLYEFPDDLIQFANRNGFDILYSHFIGAPINILEIVFKENISISIEVQ